MASKAGGKKSVKKAELKGFEVYINGDDQGWGERPDDADAVVHVRAESDIKALARAISYLAGKEPDFAVDRIFLFGDEESESHFIVPDDYVIPE